MIEKEDPIISEEEAAQYDRQIRLWGLDAQKRLRGSRVLLAGLGGLGAEVAKNLILAGVKGLTLLDHEQVSEDSCRAQFLVPVSAQGQNRARASLERAQNLNPMVEVHADPDRVEDKPDDFFLQFDATARFCSLKEALEVDWTSEKAKAALKRTPLDYFLLHVLLKFRTDKGRDPDPKSFTEDGQLLRQIRDDVLEALALSSDLLNDDFISYCFSEVSPVCAVVGGVLGQEVVKALSQRDAPHRNFFFFNGRKGSGVVDYFGPN
uniref:SUMO1 activating enzyme subunit 1 n=1 Tax=Kryptolebias marmoratus TaxID=37003 RepID=A0A3Q3BQQ1_KRYMA